MNKQKGFTLVELLAVIVILGILISLSTVAVAGIKEKQDQKNYENVISSILTGAKAYNAEERINDSISVSELIESGYVDFDTNEYPDLLGEEVYKVPCTGDGQDLKVKYKLNDYNDCGCEVQPEGIDSSSDTICTE